MGQTFRALSIWEEIRVEIVINANVTVRLSEAQIDTKSGVFIIPMEMVSCAGRSVSNYLCLGINFVII